MPGTARLVLAGCPHKRAAVTKKYVTSPIPSSAESPDFDGFEEDLGVRQGLSVPMAALEAPTCSSGCADAGRAVSR